jgi:hypothetical protein
VSADYMPAREMVGKTIADVTTRTVYARNLHYDDWECFEQTTLHFTDGTRASFAESTVEVDAETITENDPYEDDDPPEDYERPEEASQ